MKKPTLLLSLIIMSSVSFAGGYKINDEARDFSLKNVDGKPVSLKDYETAKGFIVIFTCNHCPFSIAYEDRIIALNNKYMPLGYPVIAINPNDAIRQPLDSYEEMIVRAREKGFTFPYLHDVTQEIAASYGATRTPHVYVLKNENGKKKVKYIGAIDNNSDDAKMASTHFVEQAVDALLEGKEVELKETKAIGCTIKWKQ
ncbi:MAG TPA: thioredoxin family protein [Bacteroidia bacterium]|nr:thioredoxin family protein [Bacteroidia bacterium]HNS13350.1 thioredoxin family protein [Bacteroidia bacterium]